MDEEQPINARKQAFVERIGSECEAESVPFFLELLAYYAEGLDVSSKEFAERKPHKVIAMMKGFSKPRYKVNVLKVEVPVNMKYVASFGSSEAVYTREEALCYFKEQSDATQIPFIFLSAGVSAMMFQETLRFAKDTGSRFMWPCNLGQSCGSLYERRKRPNDRVAQNKRTKEYRRTWTDRSCLWDCMEIGKSGSQLESWFFCDKVEYLN